MKNSFGEFLRQKRQEKNLTQKELSVLLFVSESAVSKWERDVARPDIALLPKLSDILGVSEHELITASVDNKAREERAQAKKWRALTFSWSLFFYIGYGIALLTCFIVNLAVDQTLSWFWIVLSALLLAFTFTNLPSILKRHKLILLPMSSYLALVLLLGVCCIYTGGNWFFIPTLATLLGLIIIFMPIIISKYEIFAKIRRFNDFISIAIDFVLLGILLTVINVFTFVNGYSDAWWVWSIALPIVAVVYLILNLLLSARFLKINRFLKTSIILFLINAFLYLPPLFLKSKNEALQREIDDANILNANLLSWQIEQIEANVHLLICLTLLLLAVSFLVVGLIRNAISKNKISEEFES